MAITDQIIYRPVGQAEQLFILSYSSQDAAEPMHQLAQRLAEQFKRGCIVQLRIDPFETSEKLLTEPALINQWLTDWLGRVQYWQQQTQLTSERTALITHAHAAVLALESVRRLNPGAARVFAIAGRFLELPQAVPERCTLHLIHGKNDTMMPYKHTVDAAYRLVAMQADVTADVLPFEDHTVSKAIQDLLLERLQNYLPKHIWDEALTAAQLPEPAKPSLH